jgi:hypothetical protein
MASGSLLGASLTEERDRRLTSRGGYPRTTRGHITCRLVKELQAKIETTERRRKEMSNRKTDGIVRRGRTWSVVLDLGVQTYRQCGACRARFWTRDGTRTTCDRDGTSLGEHRSARRRSWLSGFETKQAAKAAADPRRDEVRRRTYVPASRETLAEYLAKWLDGRSNLRRKPSGKRERVGDDGTYLRHLLRVRVGDP